MHERVFDLREYAWLKGSIFATDHDGRGELGELTRWVFAVISNYYFGEKVKVRIEVTVDDPPKSKLKEARKVSIFDLGVEE